jgi:endonuclease YncB( thermonuclease family)
MKAKMLLNLLPLGAIAIVSWFHVSSQWQQSQAKRPGYDDPTATAPAPGLLPKLQSEPATVVNVHDGDTITVKLGWQTVKVRLCGIDAPALSQPFGVQSREHLRSLLASAGNQVILYISDTDCYRRKVAEVFVPDPAPQHPEQEKILNDEMVRAGMAYHYAKYSDRCPNGRSGLVKAETEAQSMRLGVWTGHEQKPWGFRKTKQ